MKLYLVRTARAEKRSQWAGPGGGRPLTETGLRQAKGLVTLLGHTSVSILACGPSLHSRQTLEPLAKALGKTLLIDDRLDQDAPLPELVQRVHELGQRGAVVCLHRAGLLGALERLTGAGIADLEPRCERGAAWVLEGQPPSATYFAPRRPGDFSDETVSTLESIPLKPRKDRRSASPRVAILDLGSTSFHLLIVEWTSDGKLQRIDRERIMLRMGAELARSKEIRPALLHRCTEAVRTLCEVAAEHKAEQLVAVATSALREASNGAEVIEQLERTLGGPIHLLSGEEEARIIFRAIRARIELSGKTHIGIDLGGGSLEIAVGNDHDILYEKTLPLGVARMHGIIAPSEPHKAKDLRALRHALRTHLRPIADEVRSFRPAGCIAVGGTARAVARVIARCKSQNESLCGIRVTRPELDALSRDLSRLTHDERLQWPGVSARRVDLLPFGAEILNSTLSILGSQSLTLCDWGLREGILLELRSHQA